MKERTADTSLFSSGGQKKTALIDSGLLAGLPMLKLAFDELGDQAERIGFPTVDP